MANRPRPLALPELWILTLSSAALHFWHLFSPRAVVFDEVYYEKFAGFYMTGAHFFDVHPPLGRLLFLGLAKILGIGPDPLVSGVSEPALRILPATFGTLLVPLVFVVLYQLRASRRVATLGALAILLDNALLTISRLILPDIFLIVFGLAAVSAYLEARTREGRGRWGFLALSGLLAGCALSVKWTGASGLGVVLAAWFADWVIAGRPWRRFVREGALLVALPAAVYASAWAAHFALITHSGQDDLIMSTQFRMQLPGDARYNPAAPRLSLWAKIRDVHHAIGFGNASLEYTTHVSASPWYTWPVMKHPIGMWQADPAMTATSPHTMIILLGNPVVWWAALIGAAIGVVGFLVKRRRFDGREFGFFLLLGGLLLNYVPFMAIHRLMYLYHYLFALVYLVAFAAYSNGVLGERRSTWFYGGLIALMFAGFVYYAPFSYGLTLSAPAYDQRFWLLHPTF